MTFLKAYFFLQSLSFLIAKRIEHQAACTVSGNKVEIILAKHVTSIEY